MLLLFAPGQWRSTAANWLNGDNKQPSKPSDQPALPTDDDTGQPPKAAAGDATDLAPGEAGDTPVQPSMATNDQQATSPDAAAGPGTFDRPRPIGPDDADAPVAPEPGEGPLPAAVAGPDLAVPAPGDKPAGPGLPDEMPADGGPAKPAAPTVAADSPAPVGPAAVVPKGAKPDGQFVGRYVSEQDVLLKFDTTTGTWRRLPAKALLVADDHLLILPTFRPTITLANGISVQGAGPSDLTLAAANAQGIPGVAVAYGRLLLLANGKAGNQILLKLGEHTGWLEFGDGQSTAAIEVRQVLRPGKDPEVEPAVVVSELFATSGTMRWEENGQEQSLKALVVSCWRRQPVRP